MKTSLLKLLSAGVFFTLLATPVSAIKITVPKQYEEQVEAIKDAEQKQRERELKSVQSGDADSGGLDFDVVDKNDEISEANQEADEPLDADAFFVQSLAEAAATAGEFDQDAPEGQGFVSGQIVDQDTGQPISGVAILLEGTDVGTITDGDGRYTLGPALEGDYTISFIKSGYIEANVTDFSVVAGEVSVFPFALPPRPAEMSDEVYVLQDFTVSAEEANSMMTQLDLKLSSTNVLSSLSAEDFSKFAASDIADAVKKVSGVSVVGGKYAVIRGLGDRYVSSTLNYLPIASPDPDRQAVQLDLFPSALFESLEVTKSFTPDQPANSTGGINLNIKPLPDEFFASISVSTGGNSRSTGNDDFLTNDRGNSDDDFASGAEGRGLPSADLAALFNSQQMIRGVVSRIGTDLTRLESIIDRGRPAPASLFNRIRDNIQSELPSLVILDGDVDALRSGAAEVGVLADAASASISNTLSGIAANRFARKDAPGLDHGTKINIGNSHSFGDHYRFGYIGSLNYSRDFRLKEDAYYFRSSVELRETQPDLSLSPENFENPDFASGLEEKSLTEATETTSFSWMIGTGLEIGDEHQIRLHRMNLSIAEDRNARLIGNTQSDFPFSDNDPSVNDDDGFDTEIAEALYYQERELVSDQIIGKHQFDAPLEFFEYLNINWGVGRDVATQDEPGFVQISAILLNDPDPSVPGDRSLTLFPNANASDPLSQFVIFREIEEERDTRRLDFELVGDEGRNQTKIKFGYLSNESERNVFDEYLSGNPRDTLPTTDNPTRDSAPFAAADQIELVDITVAADVDMETESEGLYFMFDHKITESWRLITGLRHESNSSQVSATGDGRNSVGEPVPNIRGAGPSDPFRDLPTEGEFEEEKFYPALSLIYNNEESLNVRFAYSRTVALPSAREIGPYATSQFVGGDIDRGNPELSISDVESFDFGASLFNDLGDSISATFFHKIINGRIEKVGGLGIEPAEGVDFSDSTIPLNVRFPSLQTRSETLNAGLNSWYNNPNEASLYGIEIEARKQLEFLGGLFEDFNLGGNFTYIDGETERMPFEIASKESIGAPVSRNRVLTEQPETILNFDISYDNPDLGLKFALIYYRISDVLEAPSLGDSYDVFRKGYDQVDFTASKSFENGFKLSFSAKNLTDSERGTYYDVEGRERDRDSYKVGISYSLSGSYQF